MSLPESVQKNWLLISQSLFGCLRLLVLQGLEDSEIHAQ